MTAVELHHEAMVEADRAIALVGKGDHEAARAAFALACALETRAAEQSKGLASRAICYQSAAWLALDAGEPNLAIALSYKGIEKTPSGLLRLRLEHVYKTAQKAARDAALAASRR